MRLNKADHAAVSAAVAAAEAQSDGEIVTVVAPGSDSYHDVALHWAVLAMLGMLALLAAIPAILIVWTYRLPRELVVALSVTSLTSLAYGAFLMWAFIG